MSICPESVPLKYRSSSDYLASLPPWRRLLARLNWHPVREIEIETERLKVRKLQLRIENERIEKEIEQIRSETEQIRSETEQLRRENERLRSENARSRHAALRSEQLDARIEALFCSDGSCSTPALSSDADSTSS